MSKGFRLGSLLGFPIRVHLSFLALLAIVLVFMGGVPGVLSVLIVAASVLLHELGHALVARHLGIPVAEIGLHFFGGAAQMVGTPRRRGDEIAIAAAGPAVSFALAGVGIGLAFLTGAGLFAFVGTANLVRATELAVGVARVACVALIVAALVTGSFQLALVAVALWMFGTAERAAARHRYDPDAWRDGKPATLSVEYLPPNNHGRPPTISGPPPRTGRRPVVFVWRY